MKRSPVLAYINERYKEWLRYFKISYRSHTIFNPLKFNTLRSIFKEVTHNSFKWKQL